MRMYLQCQNPALNGTQMINTGNLCHTLNLCVVDLCLKYAELIYLTMS